MSINIPTKSQKSASVLVDALRIISWQAYKSSIKESQTKEEEFDGLEVYNIFKQEWASHEIHKMDLPKLQKFIKDLGYTEDELLEIRSKYWEQRAKYQKSNSTQSTESKIRQFKQKYSEANGEYDPQPF